MNQPFVIYYADELDLERKLSAAYLSIGGHYDDAGVLRERFAPGMAVNTFWTRLERFAARGGAVLKRDGFAGTKQIRVTPELAQALLHDSRSYGQHCENRELPT